MLQGALRALHHVILEKNTALYLAVYIRAPLLSETLFKKIKLK